MSSTDDDDEDERSAVGSALNLHQQHTAAPAAVTAEESQQIERLRKESIAMIRLLKRLRKEESDLLQKNEILAREALLCGFNPELLEAAPAATAAPTKRRKTTHKKDEG